MSIKIPEGFICPISYEIMQDPVIDPEGHSYERFAIMEWLTRLQISPITSHALSPTQLIPNRALRNAIESFRQENPESVQKYSRSMYNISDTVTSPIISTVRFGGPGGNDCGTLNVTVPTTIQVKTGYLIDKIKIISISKSIEGGGNGGFWNIPGYLTSGWKQLSVWTTRFKNLHLIRAIQVRDALGNSLSFGQCDNENPNPPDFITPDGATIISIRIFAGRYLDAVEVTYQL